MPYALSFLFSWLLITTPLLNSPVSFQQVMERSTARAHEILHYGDAEPQFVELYFPESASSDVPLIVYIHGGCWQNSFGVDHARGFAEGLRDDGFAVALVEYRRLNDEGGGWPGSLEDIVTAIEVLSSADAPSYRPNSFTLVGHSAGGHLALLASQPQRRLPVRGVLGLAAITDIEAYAAGESGCQQAGANFMATAPEQAEAMNPVYQSRHSLVFLFHGDQDTIVGAEQQQLDGAEAVEISGAGHFDLIHPGTEAFAQVLATIRSLYPELTR
ncbi:MAG: alpha/beta hydrolase [Aliidiomarina sp.]|uniref:alpha/beta hydrolase n=1 Tax=Aliidiomarina sp. TaxID=1872439 RepID=UPI0025B85D51|nr:alpha/beta hydrolase [Aliidiomarina sp.]MCH8500755.1 alpha/beta hydrolase [Aliidiomarina sp.]